MNNFKIDCHNWHKPYNQYKSSEVYLFTFTKILILLLIICDLLFKKIKNPHTQSIKIHKDIIGHQTIV